MNNPCVYIVVLNWNGWKDTIACLESIFSLSGCNYRIIVVDNNSSDDSVERMSEFFTSNNRRWNFVDYVCVENKFLFSPSLDVSEGDFFVRSDKNVGYGAGNNIGLRLVKKIEKKNFINSFFWILNNDTCVQSNALSTLLNRYILDANSGLKVGLYGTTIKNYCDRKKVIAYCGKFNKFTGASSHVTEYEREKSKFLFDKEGSAFVCYPVGASIFFNGAFVNEVGGLCEEHFLYYEEVEWVLRGFEYGWQTRIVSDSFVFHKEGASTGGGDLLRRSFVSDFYFLRSRIIIARKIGGFFEVSIFVFSLMAILRRLFVHRKGMFRNALEAVRDGFFVKIPDSWEI